MGKIKRSTWTVTFLALGVLYALFGPHSWTKDIPLETLVIRTNVLPDGWEIDHQLSLEQQDADGATENLMTVWEPAGSKDPFGASAFLMLRRYDHVMVAKLRFHVAKLGGDFPSEVYRSPEGWSYDSPYADQTYVVCSLPTAGTYCTAMARYGGFLIRFQYKNRNEPRMEAEFQTLWEEVDTYIGTSLRSR